MLLHLHKSVAMFMLNQLTTIVRVSKVQKESRFKGIWDLYDAVEADDKGKFVAGFASIAEAVVYDVLQFIETYAWFESADNKDEFPRLSLTYNWRTPDGVKAVELSQFCPQLPLQPPHLGECFRMLAKSDPVRAKLNPPSIWLPSVLLAQKGCKCVKHCDDSATSYHRFQPTLPCPVSSPPVPSKSRRRACWPWPGRSVTIARPSSAAP